jgi:hypothetical protein
VSLLLLLSLSLLLLLLLSLLLSLLLFPPAVVVGAGVLVLAGGLGASDVGSSLGAGLFACEEAGGGAADDAGGAADLVVGGGAADEVSGGASDDEGASADGVGVGVDAPVPSACRLSPWCRYSAIPSTCKSSRLKAVDTVARASTPAENQALGNIFGGGGR